MSNTFKTIARFQYSSEAQIIKGRLEADGIQVLLHDNITIDTDPLISNAIGGVKLKVPAHQVEEAEHILSSINKFSVDDQGHAIKCPNCNSEKVNLYTTIKDGKSFFAFIFALIANILTTILPFYTKYKYRCEGCKVEFELKNS